jgi:RHS repeat-associated protein
MAGKEVFMYTGKVYNSATGLYYLLARYYDPTIGRFVTEDSYAGDDSDPMTLNRYIYGRDNPERYSDSTGRSFEFFIDELLYGGGLGSFHSSLSDVPPSCTQIPGTGVCFMYSPLMTTTTAVIKEVVDVPSSVTRQSHAWLDNSGQPPTLSHAALDDSGQAPTLSHAQLDNVGRTPTIGPEILTGVLNCARGPCGAIGGGILTALGTYAPVETRTALDVLAVPLVGPATDAAIFSGDASEHRYFATHSPSSWTVGPI